MSFVEQRSLADTVAKVAERVEQFKERDRGIGEENTKAILVDPILAALGWCLDELEEVQREYRRKSQDNPVDYALFLIGQPELFVEAKALERDLNDRRWISQILGYATVVGVEWCVLTNGDEYRFYNSHAPVDVEEKLFCSVCVSDQKNRERTINTLELLSKERMKEKQIDVLWKAQTIDQHVKSALEELFSGDDQGLVRLLSRRLANLHPAEVRDSLKRADIRIAYPVISTASLATQPDTQESDVEPERAGPQGNESKRKKRAAHGVSVQDLIDAGLIAPPLLLECTYKGVKLTAEINGQGKVVFDGKEYASLSMAGGMARKTVIGAPADRPYPSTNGWTFWCCRDQGTGELVAVDRLRQEHLSQRGRPNRR